MRFVRTNPLTALVFLMLASTPVLAGVRPQGKSLIPVEVHARVVDEKGQAIAGAGFLDAHQAAPTSQMGRFTTVILTQSNNVGSLMNLTGKWVDQEHQYKPIHAVIVDLKSSVSPTHEHQEGSAYNGHFACTCYHPLFCFNQYGDVERVLLRKGNVHSADDWRSVLEPVVVR